jgi:hypothetical protein
LEDLGIHGRRILERIFGKTECEDANRIHLAQDRDQWRALVNSVTNLRVP